MRQTGMPGRPTPPTSGRRLIVGTGLTVSMGALAVLTPEAAVAATSGQWERVAQCESSGDWSINTGNGFYGGLQIEESTWQGYGGMAYAPRPDLASPADQMAIADRILAGQGWGAWPVCSRYAGAPTDAAIPPPAPPPPPQPTTAAVAQPAPAQTRPPAPPPPAPKPPKRAFLVEHTTAGSQPPKVRPGGWERLSPVLLGLGVGPDFVAPPGAEQ